MRWGQGHEQADTRGEYHEFIKAQLALAFMKILVAYYSETGNTKKVAEAIHATASTDNDAYLSKIQDVSPDELTNYDMLFLGSCCHDSDLARPFKRFLDKLPQNPRFQLAGFFTHATYTPEHTARRKELFTRWAGKCVQPLSNHVKKEGYIFLGIFIAWALHLSQLKPLFVGKSLSTMRNGKITNQN